MTLIGDKRDRFKRAGSENNYERKQMRVIRRNGNVVISLPLLDEPQPSKSGRSLLIATSRGLRKSKLKQDGSNLFYTANVFFFPVAKSGSDSGNSKKRRKKRAAAATKRHGHREK
jgi:hypothetical protein